MLENERDDQVEPLDAVALDFVSDDAREFAPSLGFEHGLGLVPNPKPHFTRADAGVQIGRSSARWSADSFGITNLTYAFRSTTASLSSSSVEARTFTRFNESQISAFELILQGWSDVANIVFTRVGTGTTGDTAYSDNASILAANYVDPTSAGSAHASQPYYNNRSATSGDGDLWIQDPNSYSNSIDYLSYGVSTIAHEMGHGLGFSHPGAYNATPGVDITYSGFAEYIEDSHQYSIMSYFSSSETGANLPGHSSAPLMDDIAAAQLKYGVNTSTRTGNTIYGFNSNADRDWFAASKDGVARPVIFCVWDAGGSDTFDFSGYYQDQLIDLNSEHFSNVGGFIGNVSIASTVTIENAIGGSGNDTFYGNSGSNQIEGGGGDDVFFADPGNDVLDGGAGADVIDGGGGADVINAGGGNDTEDRPADEGNEEESPAVEESPADDGGGEGEEEEE